MDRRAWQATVHGVVRAGHDWVTNTFTVMWQTSHVALMVKTRPASVGDVRDSYSILESGRSPRGGNGTHSSTLAWRSLVGYSPRGHKKSGTTEHLSIYNNDMSSIWLFHNLELIPRKSFLFLFLFFLLLVFPICRISHITAEATQSEYWIPNLLHSYSSLET